MFDRIRGYSKLLSTALIIFLMLSLIAAGSVESFASRSGGKVKYIAHRGLSARAPENTLAAFSLAAGRTGFYGVEFDIWESSAEQEPAASSSVQESQETEEWTPLLLVMHDPTIKRMCGVNKRVTSITRKDLDKFTIISGKKVIRYSGQSIPTAEQALDVIYSQSKGAIPVIELKHRLSGKALSFLFDLIGDRKAVIISFDYKAVKDAASMSRARGVSGNISTMYLMSKLPRSKYKATIKKLKKAGINCISLKYTLINKKTVRTFHRSGIKICAWTLPNKKAARRCARMGVDYIAANNAFF